MATYYGVNATLRDNTVPSKMIASCDNHARMRVSYDEFTLTADLAASDVINMMKIPANARVHQVVLASADLDSGATGTLDVGWTDNGIDGASANGFLSAVDVHTGAVTSLLSGVANASGFGKKFSAETQIQVKVNGDTNATSGTIKLTVHYSLD